MLAEGNGSGSAVSLKKSSESSDPRLIISQGRFTDLISKLRRTNFTEYDSPGGCPVFSMGGGDLNLKKSWHPGRAANVTRLLKQEAKAREERKRIEERRREIAKELAMLEIQRKQEANGKTVVRRRMDWMVGELSTTEANPKDVQIDEEREGFLLGRPRKAIKELKKEDTGKTDSVKLEPGIEKERERDLPGKKPIIRFRTGHETETSRKDTPRFMVSKNSDSAAVARNKVYFDPLFQIKRQEKRKYEEMTREREMESRRPRKVIKWHEPEEGGWTTRR
jgi:N-terminal domain of CBF1 interacting co-repressor CIR/Pre-mRNA splicing factor